MKTCKQLLQIAINQLGNTGGKYRSYVHASGSWCDMFVFWLYDANGCGSLLTWKGQQRTYCPASIKWCRSNLAEIPLYLAMPCDIFYMDWDKNGVPNHIGIVESKVSTSSIKTIEGNTNGGKVARKTRAGVYNCGLFRPHFAPTGLKKQVLAVDGSFEYQSIYMLQVVLGLKPTGILDKATVMALQKKAGAKADGAWGANTSGAVQKMCGLTGKAIDKQFGAQSVKALQNWINKQYKPSVTPTPKPTPKPVMYGGSFPNLVTHSGQKIAYTARDLAWAKGTKKSIYTYPKGKARQSFINAINKVYPNRSKWSAQCRAGASCDVGAGTIIRYSGIDKNVPRGLSEQIPHFKKSSLWKNTGLSKCSMAGDVAMHSGKGSHIWIGLGDGNLAEANHTWKYFEHIVKDTRSVKGKQNGAVYRATKATPMQIGDKGTEVKKWQLFLNWAGFNCGTPDADFGMNTQKQTKAFQKASGLEDDGVVGAKTIEKAKVFKK